MGCKGFIAMTMRATGPTNSTSATTQPTSVLSQPFSHVEPGKINTQILTAAL